MHVLPCGGRIKERINVADPLYESSWKRKRGAKCVLKNLAIKTLDGKLNEEPRQQ